MATRRRPSSTTPSLGDVRSTKTHEVSTKKTKKQCSRVLTCQKVKLQVYTLKYDDASVYVGEIHTESRQRHGKGVFRTSHGDTMSLGVNSFGTRDFAVTHDRHEGMYHKDKRHGRGTYLWTNGDKYIGEFYNGRVCCSSDNLPDTQHLMDSSLIRCMVTASFSVHPAGMSLKVHPRTWVRGVIAHGLKRFANGDTLQGTAGASTWNGDDGTLTGDGIKTFRNGNVYRGRLERSVQAGFGILESPLRQQTYVGMWVCNQMDGSGRLEFLSSSPLSSPSSSPNVYVGLFVKGQFHGHGRLEYATGAVYEGAYAQNRRHGRGVFRWSPTHDGGDLDFEVYEGMWEADLPHGVGYFTCQHAAFHGQWCRGYPHGAGMYTCRASGDRRRHEFRHGQCIDDPNIVFDRVSVVS
ncbi:hypothetical protein DYB25_001501 [Aphanomyces astaci]|uniref:Uncharacterized protein n=1 Tax=Aphanomyces astaci TaxID=112090 RepID=A0A397A8S9_APHAT|nr:hypothetical protein DYB25_001501 [Aphanomyces astaci]